MGLVFSPKAKITKEGILRLARGGEFVTAMCPFGGGRPCSHSCPLWLERWETTNDRTEHQVIANCSVGYAYYDIIEDERGKRRRK